MTAVRYSQQGIQLRRWLLATLLLAIALPGLAAAIQDDWQGVERIVAIGDIHGDYDNYMAVLKNAGVVNRRGRWAAGKTHVVQVGDIPDRGRTPSRSSSIYRNSKTSQEGRRSVTPLIGNHEHMNITGDLRYVHPGEYEAFETRNSKQLRNNYYAYVVKTIEHSARRSLPVAVMPATCRWRTMTSSATGTTSTPSDLWSIGSPGKKVESCSSGSRHTIRLFALTMCCSCMVG